MALEREQLRKPPGGGSGGGEGGGGRVILNVTSFFTGVVLFVIECDTGGRRGSKNGHFCVTSFLNAPLVEHLILHMDNIPLITFECEIFMCNLIIIFEKKNYR